MTLPAMENLAPDRFAFWPPPAGAAVLAGAERQPFGLPSIPLPVRHGNLATGTPADAAIGQDLYDYLREFPDCPGNSLYAELLRDAFPHFISDLAAQAVMIDAKQVEPAFVVRKLTCLKILHLLEPGNTGLLRQLCRGYFELSLEFAELVRCRTHLRQAMRFGQILLALEPDDRQALSLLAEIDFLLGDAPAAVAKWQRLATLIADPATLERIAARIAACPVEECPESALVDDLEAIAEAMQRHAAGDEAGAVAILERLEAAGRLTTALPSADFYWLLGICRLGDGDTGGALLALHRALELDPGHAATRQTLEAL